MNIDVGAVDAPGIGSDCVGDKSGKKTIEVKEEEDGPGARVSKGTNAMGEAWMDAYRMLQIRSSTR